MDDQRTDREGSALVAFIKRVDWLRIVIGFAIYYAMMAVWGISTALLALWANIVFNDTEHLNIKTDYWYFHVLPIYATASLGIAYWWSGRIISKRRK